MCVSEGVASLLPNEFDKEQIVYPYSNFEECSTVLLMNRQIDYIELARRAEVVGLKKKASSEAAEVWSSAAEFEE
jgi:hypothetical protein